MESEDVDRRDAKSRTRRRRSMRNLRDGLPGLGQTESADDCYGSLWMETDEPFRKKKKRRSSMFVGLPALQSTPIREEITRLDSPDVAGRKSEAFVSKDTARDSCEVKNDNIALSHATANCKDDIQINNAVDTDFINRATEVIGICGDCVKPDLERNKFISKENTNCDSEMTAVKEQSTYADVPVNSGDGSDDECKLSSPDVSLTKMSPSSMSPDYPASPSLVASFTNHGESFIESETLITRSLFPVGTKTKTDMLVDSYTDLNTSDKENISQNLDLTPTEQQDGNNTKDSPSFFSLCKSVAGKVVTFVKTSPSYLTNALLNSKTPPRILKDTHDIDNTSERQSLNSPSTTCKHGDPMPVDHSDNIADRRQWLHEKVNIAPEEMGAETDAEISERLQTHQNDTSEVKDNIDLVRPFKSESEVFSEKKLRAKSTGSVKKKRDYSLYYSTFNAISAVYNNEEPGATDEVFTSDFRQRVKSAPEMPKSSSCSVTDIDMMDQLMQEAGNTDTPVLEGHTNTDSSAKSSNNIIPATESSHSDIRGSETCQNTVTLETPLMEKHSEFLFHNSELIRENLDSEESASKPNEERYNLEQRSETDERKDQKTSDSCTFSDREQKTSNNAMPMLTVDEHKDVLVTEQKMCVTTDDETMSKEKPNETDGKCQSAKFITHRTEVSEKMAKVMEMARPEFRREKISRDKTVRDQSICGVSQRKRKHQVPVKELTEKTVLNKVKDSASEISSEEQLPSTVAAKRVKAKYVAPKRKLGQFSVSTKMASDIISKEEVSSCSVSKKKKTSYGTEQSSVSKIVLGKKQQRPYSSNIEERISKLAINSPAEKAKSTKKPEVNVTKHRRRSANFDVIADIGKEIHHVEVCEQKRIAMPEVAQFCAGKDLAHEGKNEKTNTQDNLDKSNEPGPLLVESLEADNEVSTKTKGKGRRRRSSTFKDIAASKLEDISEAVMEVTKITEEISQVNLKETSSPQQEQSDEALPITVNNLILPEDHVVPRRRRRRSAESASLKIQMICETTATDSPDDSQSPNLGPVTALKGSRKRKHESKISEEELEKLYRNKNFVKPENCKPWHTILESPGTSGDLYGKKRLQRIIDFERPTQMKLRRRLQKAAKNGWDARKKKRIELKDDFVETKLAALSGELDESSDTLADSLKDIVETK